MVKAIELGLLAVSILVFLGLILSAPSRRRSRLEADTTPDVSDGETTPPDEK